MATVQAAESPLGSGIDDPQWTETTRLMCAAAYLDGTFAQEVIEEVVEEPFRAVQVPQGVDIVPVVKHCLAARHQKDVRDAVLAGLLVLSVVASVTSAGTGALVIAFLLAWAVVGWDLWASTYHVATRRLSATAFRPEDAPTVDDAAIGARLAELASRQAGNVTVYSGFNPFSGSGFDEGGWSFAVDLRKGSERLGERGTPTPFASGDLHAAVDRTLMGLGVEGLRVEERIFVQGTDIRTDRELLPDVVGRPVAHVDARVLERCMEHQSHRVRHYKCIRVVDWRGELVVSFFLRFSVSNGRLFTELSRFLLTPLKAEHRRIDAVEPELTLRQALRILGRSLALTPALWMRSPTPILRPLLRRRRGARRLRRVKRDFFFDYGAPVTALDRARSRDFTRYFQKLDREMYVKVLERALLDTIVDFLDDHGVDTRELADRRETIINNGIMVPGGSVQAHNIAVGQGAKILTRLRSGVPGRPATAKGG